MATADSSIVDHSTLLTFITVMGGILTLVVGAVIGAMKIMWGEIKELRVKHDDCEKSRMQDKLNHWREIEELRSQAGMSSKPPPLLNDPKMTQMVIPPIPSQLPS